MFCLFYDNSEQTTRLAGKQKLHKASQHCTGLLTSIFILYVFWIRYLFFFPSRLFIYIYILYIIWGCQSNSSKYLPLWCLIISYNYNCIFPHVIKDECYTLTFTSYGQLRSMKLKPNQNLSTSVSVYSLFNAFAFSTLQRIIKYYITHVLAGQSKMTVFLLTWLKIFMSFSQHDYCLM